MKKFETWTNKKNYFSFRQRIFFNLHFKIRKIVFFDVKISVYIQEIDIIRNLREARQRNIFRRKTGRSQIKKSKDQKVVDRLDLPVSITK